MRKLVAKRPVLYRSTQYRAGDALPADNQAMVDAWLEAKSAEWVDEANDAPAKAEPVAETAEPEEATEPEEPKKKTPAKKATTKKEGK